MEFVSYSVNDGIAHIKMNRPEKLNTLSTELIHDFHTALDLACSDQTVRVIILSGNGSSFCAGGDLETIKKLKNQEEAYYWLDNATALTAKLRSISKLVIAAVHGHASGAGFSLALASDFIIAERDAKFTISFSKVGLIPDLGLFQLLLERIPVNLLKEWIVFGTVLSSELLYQKGVINRMAEKSAVDDAFLFSQNIIKGSPLSQKYSKKILNQLLGEKVRNSLAVESMHQLLLLQSEDFQEGIQAFIEKRPPIFKGK
ncbi:2-(1,2-epoxy-1,2-dihydrophenyl)acetyl-CoA isomerase [Bacillus oleivorans]|uniref:2-(1,2-epoxy-1,2-dihydrophenyl)acetyl-CoA isomerase n=1 Tax=Bacillus oleivorans TaxID=1448271 RepID=A0A285CPI7_9BACI|nr:enoyl-CoA hydratase/isomerase family protein [Bacillus oleivorans]SNX68883.1 2-(1,2-epoxy-1,2-dihydrophenyl)acetyl-CoA isomerase [Bacillus oleivorans]